MTTRYQIIEGNPPLWQGTRTAMYFDTWEEAERQCRQLRARDRSRDYWVIQVSMIRLEATR